MRPADPVVITGAQVPRLVGATPAPSSPSAWMTDPWDQVPGAGRRARRRSTSGTSTTPRDRDHAAHLHRPGHVGRPGPRPQGRRRRRDRVHGHRQRRARSRRLAARRASWPAPASSAQSPTRWATRRAATSTSSARRGGLDPGRGRRYVDYHFGLRSGDYKTTYKLQRRAQPRGLDGHAPPPTRHHFSDRWARRPAHGARGAARRAPTSSTATRTFRARQLRPQRGHVLGGRGRLHRQQERAGARAPLLHRRQQRPLHQRQHVFYEQREDITHLPARPRDRQRSWTSSTTAPPRPA